MRALVQRQIIHTLPWHPSNSELSRGFCIDASRQQVLTNAHVVSHAVGRPRRDWI